MQFLQLPYLLLAYEIGRRLFPWLVMAIVVLLMRAALRWIKGK
jgi:hypothetical protein